MSLFASIFAPGEQARADDLARRSADLERRRYEMGRITEEEMHRNVAMHYGNAPDVGNQVGAAFNEGLAEGYENTTGAIRATVAAPFRFAWDIIPWQLWLGAAVFLFFYIGGGTYLKGILKK